MSGHGTDSLEVNR